jgi:hypothetical protein
MDKMTILEVTDSTTKEVTEYAIIENADGSFTSMPKSEYDRRQAEQSTPMIPSDE